MPIRGCFKEQKPNILRIVYNHKDTDAHQDEEQALEEGLWWMAMDITQLPPSPVLTVWNRTLVFKFSVSFCGELFPFLPSQHRATGSTCRESAAWSSTPPPRSYFLIWRGFSHLGRALGGWGIWCICYIWSSHYLWNLTINEWYSSYEGRQEELRVDGIWEGQARIPFPGNSLYQFVLFLFRFNFKPKFYC